MKKIDSRSALQSNVHESVQVGVILAIVGGFLDAYTFIGRGGVFANAQTGNIVLLAVNAAQREWKQALATIPPILAFVIGVFVAESIKDKSSHFFILDWKREVIILEIVTLFIIGFLPASVPNIVVTVAISFVASIQVSSFRKLVDSPFNTAMITGNLRSASHAAYLAMTQRDRKAAKKSIRYFAIIAAFLLGAFLGGILTLAVGVKSVWIAVIILIFAIIFFHICERKGNVEKT